MWSITSQLCYNCTALCHLAGTQLALGQELRRVFTGTVLNWPMQGLRTEGVQRSVTGIAVYYFGTIWCLCKHNGPWGPERVNAHTSRPHWAWTVGISALVSFALGIPSLNLKEIHDNCCLLKYKIRVTSFKFYLVGLDMDFGITRSIRQQPRGAWFSKIPEKQSSLSLQIELDGSPTVSPTTAAHPPPCPGHKRDVLVALVCAWLKCPRFWLPLSPSLATSGLSSSPLHSRRPFHDS